MITCNDCKRRKNFNLVGMGESHNVNMCMEKFSYVNLDTYYTL